MMKKLKLIILIMLTFPRRLLNVGRVKQNEYLGLLTITRFGVVLGSNGGAFPKMLKPFTLSMGVY